MCLIWQYFDSCCVICRFLSVIGAMIFMFMLFFVRSFSWGRIWANSLSPSEEVTAMISVFAACRVFWYFVWIWLIWSVEVIFGVWSCVILSAMSDAFCQRSSNTLSKASTRSLQLVQRQRLSSSVL